MKITWLTFTCPVSASWRPLKISARSAPVPDDEPPDDPPDELPDVNRLNRSFCRLSKLRTNEPEAETCGSAFARSSRYLPCTHFWYSIAFWISRLCDAAMASASSSVSTFTAPGSPACEAACPVAWSIDATSDARAADCADEVADWPPSRTATSSPTAAARACRAPFPRSHCERSSRIV